ncbi:hypothetical protein F0562_021176 [Nyssa sinensis]|uniref:40S ribosomal protein S15 n=1 Tax=Nyssa sinensis TaxID=561372 RepID=A0A5J5BKH0_9ASTE|nr:hypothetical protein F0562_021176 [Nyssa sinensis]
MLKCVLRKLAIELSFDSPSVPPGYHTADADTDVVPGMRKKRTFKKFSFRGVDLDALLDMSTDELVKLCHARARRRFQRGLKRKPIGSDQKNCARL